MHFTIHIVCRECRATLEPVYAEVTGDGNDYAPYRLVWGFCQR